MTPIQELRERIYQIDSGENPVPQKLDRETDGEYLTRIIERQKHEPLTNRH